VADVAVPDIGDFTDVPVVEVFVSVGDTIAVDDPIVELESDKASFEVPSTVAGTVTEVRVSVGDKVGEGSVLIVVESDAAAPAAEEPKTDEPKAEAPKAEAPAAPAQPAAAADFERSETHAQVLVLGSGPGGYSAACA
jgi:pyruvate/2-oxoglutarate dehydrogenase complex dihydrolipoamide acyltransferase (E2) component